MKVVGLTGGIATGKSTVAHILHEEHGVPVIDADRVARDVVAPGTPGLAQVVEAFGPHVLGPDGALDRPALRRRVMGDEAARRRLEAITHPAIRAAIARELARLAGQGAPRAVVEAALLVETGSWRMYPELVVVTCDPTTQLQRVMARDGVSEPQARAVVSAQLPMADKEAVATHVIRNDGSLDDLRAEVARVWREITGA